MVYPKLKQIEEVDCGDDTTRVDEYLQKGWVLLKIRLATRDHGEGKTEYPIYILGLPLE